MAATRRSVPAPWRAVARSRPRWLAADFTLAVPPATPSAAAAGQPRRVAVIDIGATAIRLEIAEVFPDRAPRVLESLSQPVRLGTDTFTTGTLRRETIEECARILRDYRGKIDEYDIRDEADIRAIATSAVKEAANRDAFLDRMYVATGLTIECAEDADLVRLTYLAVRSLPWRDRRRAGPALVVEVGGGSTEVLLLQGGRVGFYETYPLGAVRLRQTLETGRVSAPRQRRTIDDDVRRTVEQMAGALPVRRVATLIAVSGDMRFAAERLVRGWDALAIGTIQPRALARFADSIMALTPEDLVARHGLSFTEAETVGPSLVAYVAIAAEFGVRRILVPKVHLRTAMELEMSSRPDLAAEFREHIRHAADMLADRYLADRDHARHVARLAMALFDQTSALHRLGPRQRFLLEIAARLHEIGQYVSNRSHHKHSMYLILNSELFGVSRDDLAVIALTARYHRKSPPRPNHAEYMALPRDRRVIVQKLAALLRVADALDRGHQRRVCDIRSEIRGSRFVVAIPDVDDLTIERLAMREKGQLFEDLFGLTIELARGTSEQESDDI